MTTLEIAIAKIKRLPVEQRNESLLPISPQLEIIAIALNHRVMESA